MICFYLSQKLIFKLIRTANDQQTRLSSHNQLMVTLSIFRFVSILCNSNNLNGTVNILKILKSSIRYHVVYSVHMCSINFESVNNNQWSKTDINIAHLPLASQWLIPCNWDHLFCKLRTLNGSCLLIQSLNSQTKTYLQYIFLSTHMIKWDMNAMYCLLSLTIFLLLNKLGVWDKFGWADNFKINIMFNYRLTFISNLIFNK